MLRVQLYGKVSQKKNFTGTNQIEFLKRSPLSKRAPFLMVRFRNVQSPYYGPGHVRIDKQMPSVGVLEEQEVFSL